MRIYQCRWLMRDAGSKEWDHTGTVNVTPILVDPRRGRVGYITDAMNVIPTLIRVE